MNSMRSFSLRKLQLLRQSVFRNFGIQRFSRYLYYRLGFVACFNHHYRLSPSPWHGVRCDTLMLSRPPWDSCRYCHSLSSTDTSNNQTDEEDRRNSGHENEETDLVKMSSDILGTAREIDVTLFSVSVADVKRNLESLINLGGNARDWQSLMKKCPSLVRCTDLDEVLNLLSEFGFSWKMIQNILQGYSSIVRKDRTKLKDTIEYLQNAFRNEQKLNGTIIANPGILSADSDYIAARLEMLGEWFKHSDVLNLLYKCPSVLFDDVTELQEKYEYVHHVMGISQRQILYSNLFEHSLLHIQARHMFLVRAGFFKKIKKDKGQIDSNPRLQDIIDSSDRKFASKFGGMSEQDYICFVEYFQREKEISNLDDE